MLLLLCCGHHSENSGEFVPMLTLDCRGFIPIEFAAMVSTLVDPSPVQSTRGLV